MQRGERVRVRVDGELLGATVARILDRRGRDVFTVETESAPPFTTVVLILDEGGERLCVPLWTEGESVQTLRLVA